MGCHSGRKEALSLGAFMDMLRGGCECVCCGAVLRAVGAGAATLPSGTPELSGIVVSAVAFCPYCGCEVAKAVAREGADGLVALESAA